METLVLDVSYQPVQLIPWQRAITLWFEGKVEIVHYYDERDLHSATITMKMPSVVRFLKNALQKKKQVKFSRENVLARDGYKCQYCSARLARHQTTYDHVIPRSQGGQTNWGNVATCCVDCNQRKGGRTPEQAGMKLLKQPVKPTKLPQQNFTIVYHKNMPFEWRTWLRDIEYWNGELEQD